MSTFTLNHKTYDLTKYPSVFKLWAILAFDSVTMNATTEPIIEFCDKTGWNPTMAMNYIYGRASTNKVYERNKLKKILGDEVFYGVCDMFYTKLAEGCSDAEARDITYGYYQEIVLDN